eukprot:7770079-Heterocapsa_arctica.AAC.1
MAVACPRCGSLLGGAAAPRWPPLRRSRAPGGRLRARRSSSAKISRILSMQTPTRSAKLSVFSIG